MIPGNQNSNGGDAPKYLVNIGGQDYTWDSASITPVDIRNLMGWDKNQPLEEVDLKSGTKTVLANDAVIELKPGRGYAKKIEFDRGSVLPSGAWAQ